VGAWAAAEGRLGRELGLDWIDPKDEATAQAGWVTWSSLVAIRNDGELDLAELERLLQRVTTTIHEQPDAVRYSMNDFVIALGTHVAPLHARALQAATKIGEVSCDMGNTACEVPLATAALTKAKVQGAIGKKRKTAKC
jgi:hypothetical protein